MNGSCEFSKVSRLDLHARLQEITTYGALTVFPREIVKDLPIMQDAGIGLVAIQHTG